MTGNGIKEWKIEPAVAPATGKILVISPEKPLQDDYSLKLDLEAPLAKLPAEVAVPQITVLGAAQANGNATVTAESQLDVTPKVLESVARSLAGTDRSQIGAFRLLRQPYTLTFDVAEAKPQVEATSKTLLSVRREAATLSADFSYLVRRVGIFETRLAVPAGWTVSDVKGQIESWSLDAANVVIKLPKQTAGDFSFTLTARQNRAQPIADVTLPVFAPQGVTRHEEARGARFEEPQQPGQRGGAHARGGEGAIRATCLDAGL